MHAASAVCGACTLFVEPLREVKACRFLCLDAFKGCK